MSQVSIIPTIIFVLRDNISDLAYSPFLLSRPFLLAQLRDFFMWKSFGLAFEYELDLLMFVCNSSHHDCGLVTPVPAMSWGAGGRGKLRKCVIDL